LDSGRDDRHGWDFPVATAGHALAAMGALPAGLAQEIVNDYLHALAYRNDEYEHFAAYHPVPAPGPSPAPGPVPSAQPAIGPVRAVTCPRVIEQPWGELETS